MNLSPIKISAKNIAQTALEDFCPRCYWLKLKMQFKLPFSSFPGIFSTIDSYTKKCVHHTVDCIKNGTMEPPEWVKQIGTVVDYLPVPSWQKSLYHDAKSNITLSGVADDFWMLSTGKKAILDFKTAIKTNTQDKLLPLYEIQAIIYSILLDKDADLYLVYMEPKTSNESACSNILDCGFAMQFSGVVVPVENDKKKVRQALSYTRETLEMPVPPPGRSGCKDCSSLDLLIGLLK